MYKIFIRDSYVKSHSKHFFMSDIFWFEAYFCQKLGPSKNAHLFPAKCLAVIKGQKFKNFFIRDSYVKSHSKHFFKSDIFWFEA